MCLLLALEVYSRLLIYSLGFMAVDRNKKHLLGLTQTIILTLASFLLSHSGFGQNEGRGEYI